VVEAAQSDVAPAPEATLAAGSADTSTDYVGEQADIVKLAAGVHELRTNADVLSVAAPKQLHAAALEAVVTESGTGVARRPSKVLADDDWFEFGYGADA
jgi:hypothetical protein